MNKTAKVDIIGAMVACSDGLKDSWREVASWAADQLAKRFGDNVKVNYYDLFDPNCPPIPENSQLPVVIINEQVVSSNDKVSIPAIRKHLETIGIYPINQGASKNTDHDRY